MNGTLRRMNVPTSAAQLERFKQKFRGSEKDWEKLREIIMGTFLPETPSLTFEGKTIGVTTHAKDQVIKRFPRYCGKGTEDPLSHREINMDLCELVRLGHIVDEGEPQRSGDIADLGIECTLFGFDQFHLRVTERVDALIVVTVECSESGAPLRLGGKDVSPPRWESWRQHNTVLALGHLWTRSVFKRNDWSELFSHLLRFEYPNEGRGWGFVYSDCGQHWVSAPTAHYILDFLVTGKTIADGIIEDHVLRMVKRYRLGSRSPLRIDAVDEAWVLARPLGVRVASPSATSLGLELLDSLTMRARESEDAALSGPTVRSARG